jgi:small GTP-binding protein
MPSEIDDLIREFPASAQEQLKSTWAALPAEAQSELKKSLEYLPKDLVMWRMLLDMALHQFKLAFGEKHAIAIVGPANVGKSTLYNQLIRFRGDQAAVSALPGTTRVNQRSDAGLFEVVDTPGADSVGEVGELERRHALDAARAADVLVIVFDAIQGIKRTEQELFDELVALGKPFIVVLNKVDLVRHEEQRVTSLAAANLRLGADQIIAVAAKDGSRLDRVLLALAKTEPAIVAALAQALPAFRWRLAWAAITTAASTSAAIALAPLPIIDMVPLLVVQSSLVLGIGRIYNYEVTPQRAKELAVTFGLGFLGRTLFQELSKLGGPPGWLLGAAIAASTTIVMGYTAAVWFERGERPTGESMKKMTRQITDTLVEALRSFGQKAPDRKSLEEKLSRTLSNSPMAESQETLDKNVDLESPSAGPGAADPAVPGEQS